jgi:hypothetical protein
MKSRVNRARGKLAELMGVTGAEEFGSEHAPNPRARAV